MQDEEKTKGQLIDELVEMRQQIAGMDTMSIQVQDSKERFRQLSEATFEAIAITENGTIVDVNSKFLQMFGYESLEVIGMNAVEFVAPPYQDLVRQKISSQYEEVYESHLLRKDGTRFIGEVRGKTLRQSNRSLRVTVVLDITQHKEAEESRQKAHDQLEQRVSARTAEQVQSNQQLQQEIIQRRKAEEELQAAEQYLNTVLLNMPAGMAILEGPEFRYYKINKTLADINGLSIEAHLGRPLAEVLPHAAPEILPRMRHVLETGQPAPHHEFNTRLPKDPDKICWFLDWFFPIVGDNGVPMAVGAVVLDITNRIEAEQALQHAHNELEQRVQERTAELQQANAQLKTTQQQLIQQERLRALGEMAAGMTHDFNNTLFPILGYSDLLLDDPNLLKNPQQVASYLQFINTAAQDAASVVRRLREFYRHRDPDDYLALVNPTRLVESAISLTQPKWKDEAQAAGITITMKTDLLDMPPIAGREPELREVLTNLIFNAVDAMTEDGTITLRTRRETNHIQLEVVDTGVGMTEEVKQRCFDPFFSTKGKYGTGLGLSTIYGIIERHQGEITILSTLEVGTTFQIRLPIYQATTLPHPPSVEEVAIPKLHLLVVEDDSAIRQMLTDFFTADGHTVETASTGHEGLEKFNAGSFDGVITDRAMPDLNGDQLAAVIKAHSASTPVIMLTGFGEMMQLTGELPFGVDLIVPKPIALRTLREALAKVVS